ncbi:MAG: SufE family protein, partial [Prevotellaceae bacterium]|nr:SufE family protein [Prevotellaceae bacterium]
MTINEAQNEIIAEFEFLEDWLDRYQQIIDSGREGKGIDPKYKTPEHLIEGCQSKVWLMAELHEGKVYYQAESNTDIAGGIAA